MMRCSFASRRIALNCMSMAGRAVVQAVLAVLAKSGAEIITPESAAALELLGAGMHGTVALNMQRARTLTAARLLAGQLDSGLTQWCGQWRAWLLETPREPRELWPLHAAAQWLLRRSEALARLLTPPRIALVGPPNAGKSTLANALLGRPVAITSDIAGTTRDWVDATAIFANGNVQAAVTLVDTAGVRMTEDPLEQLSIQRTQQQAAAADLVIFVHDATRPEAAETNDASFPNRVLKVQNKSDLAGTAPLVAGAIAISAKTGAGLGALMRAALARLEIADVDESEPFAFAPQQIGRLRALASGIDAQMSVTLLESLRGR